MATSEDAANKMVEEVSHAATPSNGDTTSPPLSQSLSAFHSHRSQPDEVATTDVDEEYVEFRKQTDFRDPYRIPHKYLLGTRPFAGFHVPETPLLAFINARSGGYVGARLTSVLSRSLGQGQVYDVATYHPSTVLKALWSNLTTAASQGDEEAAYIQQNLRIVVAGGDGTITWVLGCVKELGLDPQPAVGIMPLGTGNDLSLSLGWGQTFDWSWVKGDNLYHTLMRYKDAEVRFIDCWKMTITAPDATGSFYDETPHSLKINENDAKTASAMFWNYFSIGLDAEAAYGFHSLREKHPKLASGRALNQAWYGLCTCASGWFCGAAPLTNKVTKLRVKTKSQPDNWEEVQLPSSLRAVVVLNLQSYGGGRDIWGLASTSDFETRGFSNPTYSDGSLEVVGFHSGWHAAAVMGQMSSKIHAKRLAQATEIEFTLEAQGRPKVKGETGTTHMQLDGEPWPQAIPIAGESEGPIVITVSSCGVSKLLCNTGTPIGGKKIRSLTKRGAEMSYAVAEEMKSAETTVFSGSVELVGEVEQNA